LTVHRFIETGITPADRTINIRNVIDSEGPHLITFGSRTTVADPTAGQLAMYVYYETPEHQLIGLPAPSSVDLTELEPSLGGAWYARQVMTIDGYFPDYSGVYPEETRGMFKIVFDLAGPAGTSKFAYECVVNVDDGSPAVVNHP
jgi:hypothetical protein